MTWLDDLEGRTAADVVHGKSGALPASTTVGELRSYFEASSSKRLALIADGDRYVGAIAADSLPPEADDGALAADYVGADPTIDPAESARAAAELALNLGTRRLPVVADDGTLVGLIAINRESNGLCGA